MTIDVYLSRLDDERRDLLAAVRRTIRAALPDAVECISDGMPAFRVDGRVVAGFQATASGCSYYPFSGSTLDALGDALDGSSRTKSALHFTSGPAAIGRARQEDPPGAHGRAASRRRHVKRLTGKDASPQAST